MEFQSKAPCERIVFFAKSELYGSLSLDFLWPQVYANIELEAFMTLIFKTPPKRGFLSCQNDTLN